MPGPDGGERFWWNDSLFLTYTNIYYAKRGRN